MITIKELFEFWDVTRQDVCNGLNIPYRTLQNWLTNTRKCPDYVVLMLDEWMSNHCLPRNYDREYITKMISYHTKKYKMYSEIWNVMYRKEKEDLN